MAKYGSTKNIMRMERILDPILCFGEELNTVHKYLFMYVTGLKSVSTFNDDGVQGHVKQLCFLVLIFISSAYKSPFV